MGASPYFYFVDHEPNVQAALDKLREREFKAGRYNPVMPFPRFPVDLNSPGPGARHATIDEALEASDADGTRSILDLDHVSDEPFDPDSESDDFGSLSPLGDDVLEEYFGTTEPTREQVDDGVWDIFELLERGMGIYIVVYEAGKPSELFIAGYSFD